MNTTPKHFAFSTTSPTLKSVLAGVLLLLFGNWQILPGQAAPHHDDQLKAEFLFNFTQFVEWPATAFSSANEPFTIGILGEDIFDGYLEETIAGEQVMGHSLRVQHFSQVKDIKNCHILFITSGELPKTKLALAAVGNRSILTVSDGNSFVHLGGMIGFVHENNKIKLQIKPTAAKVAGLTISSKLLRCAEIIE